MRGGTGEHPATSHRSAGTLAKSKSLGEPTGIPPPDPSLSLSLSLSPSLSLCLHYSSLSFLSSLSLPL